MYLGKFAAKWPNIVPSRPAQVTGSGLGLAEGGFDLAVGMEDDIYVFVHGGGERQAFEIDFDGDY